MAFKDDQLPRHKDGRELRDEPYDQALPTSLKKVHRAASFLLMDSANCAARFGGISLYLIELARLCDEV